MRRFGLNDKEKNALKNAGTTMQAAKALRSLSERTDRQTQLLSVIEGYRDENAMLHAIDLLAPRTPRFLYFSHYDRMSGEISIDQLSKDRQGPSGINIGDQVFLDFLEYAGTDLDDLIAADRFEELNARCEAAANRITDQIFEYWTQNDELQINVLLTEGKPSDPPPFHTGPVARARVANNLHHVSVPFSERSAGFIWFFHFWSDLRILQGNTVTSLFFLMSLDLTSRHGAERPTSIF